jgi:hypothetical protein
MFWPKTPIYLTNPAHIILDNVTQCGKSGNMKDVLTEEHMEDLPDENETTQEAGAGNNPTETRKTVARKIGETARQVLKKRLRGKTIIPEQWAAIKRSYMEDGVPTAQKLAKIHLVSVHAIYQRMHREGWKKERKQKLLEATVAAQADEIKRVRVEGCKGTAEVEDGPESLEALVSRKREDCIRDLSEVAGALLKKLRDRVGTIGPQDDKEMKSATDTLKSLHDMLGELLGTAAKAPGGGGAGGTGAIRVNILAVVAQKADDIKGAAFAAIAAPTADGFEDLPEG